MLLTIAIPTYNRSDYLYNLLYGSLLLKCQEYKKNIQLLICDNHSTDDTEKIAQNCIYEFPNLNITYFKQPENLGFYINLLTIYKMCTSQYIWYLSDDDGLNTDSISSVVDYLSVNNPTVLVLGVDSIDGIRTPIEENRTFYSPDDYEWPKYFGRVNYLSTLILKKSDIDFTFLFSSIPNLFPQVTLSLLLLKQSFVFSFIGDIRSAKRNMGHISRDFFDLYCIDLKEAILLANWTEISVLFSETLKNNLIYFIKLQFLVNVGIFKSINGFPLRSYLQGVRYYNKIFERFYITISFIVSFFPSWLAKFIYIAIFSIKYFSIRKSFLKYKASTAWTNVIKTSDV